MKFNLLLLLVLFPVLLAAQESDDSPVLKLDFPLFDLPYQIDAGNTVGGGFFSSYASMSMNQSLAITTDVYSAFHWGMKKMYDTLTWEPLWKNVLYIGGTVAGIGLLAYLIPFGYPWMQQEFTRSILTRFDIHSVNGYYYNLLNPSGVIGVTDAELEHLKAKSPQDMIRIDAAGIEGYTLLSDYMLHTIFFYNARNLSNITALAATVFGVMGKVPVGLFAEYGFSDVDGNVNDDYAADGDQTSRRLFSQPAINWVYDLFRPDEPYSARGAHPSGDGVARYIRMSHLTADEKRYLALQGGLSMLNFVSPLLYGFNPIPLGSTGAEGSFALHHYLTSFGADVSASVYFKKSPFNIAFTYHNYFNYKNYFFAVEAELLDFPIRFTPAFGILVSPRVMIGMQPKDQAFKTGTPEFFGLAGFRVDFVVSGYILPYLEVAMKTNGWVAGSEYLDSNIRITLGVSARF